MDQTGTKLTGKQAKYLRSLGHSLKPLLLIGKSGLTDNFIKQVRSTLDTHELIKVKLGKTSEVELKMVIERLTNEVPCQLAQSIGKTLLLYKPNEEDPKIKLPG